MIGERVRSVSISKVNSVPLTPVNQELRNIEFNSFKVKVSIPEYGTQILHFAHHRSSNPNAFPFIVCHGWPGSFLEAWTLLKPLTEPSSEA